MVATAFRSSAYIENSVKPGPSSAKRDGPAHDLKGDALHTLPLSASIFALVLSDHSCAVVSVLAVFHEVLTVHVAG